MSKWFCEPHDAAYIMINSFSPAAFQAKTAASPANDSLIDHAAVRSRRNSEISHLATRQELQDERNHSINELNFITGETSFESPETGLTSPLNTWATGTAQAQPRAENIRHRRSPAMTEQQFQQILARPAHRTSPPATSPLNNNF
ncbi:MAG: hypothetical protein I8H77_18000 [Comamonadaceae bacterium]|nr:hypothetical protein [Comamonadaceae bacterium]